VRGASAQGAGRFSLLQQQKKKIRSGSGETKVLQ
jgi:hypothetical protein